MRKSNDIKDFILNLIKKHPFLVLAFTCIVVMLIGNISPGFFLTNSSAIFIFSAIVLVGIGFFLKFARKLSTGKTVLLIVIGSFLLHAAYIFYTGYMTRQHDIGAIGWFGGHVGYIEYFVKNNFMLPDFNPTSVWQFYHPPLHHLISAVWVKFLTLFDSNYQQAIENIQILTLFYSGCITILSYKIFKELNFKKAAMIVSMAIVSLHPTLSILSGSINNDVLCVTLMLATVLFTIRWYKKPTIPGVMLMAVFLALSMLAKTSGFVLAPGIAVIFIVKLLQKGNGSVWASKLFWKVFHNEKLSVVADKFALIVQYFIFGVISIPLGLSWNIYNNIRWNLDFNHIPRLSSAIPQHISDNSIYHRLLDFNPIQFASVFENWTPPLMEHNIIIAILKTSMFGEFNLGTDHPRLVPFANVLFYANIALMAIAIICMVWILFKKTYGADFGLKFFLFALNVGIVAFFVAFSFDHNAIASMNFRYMVPSYIIGATFIGIAVNTLQRRKTIFANTAKWIIISVTTLFCLASICVYTLLGMQG